MPREKATADLLCRDNTRISEGQRLADRVSDPIPPHGPRYNPTSQRPSHRAIGSSSSKAPLASRVRHKESAGEKQPRKVTLRFHLLELGEKTIEVEATNYEPLRLYFDILRNKLLQMGCIQKTDRLDFRWPHLRWVPQGSTKVGDIRTSPKQKAIGCFVRKEEPDLDSTINNLPTEAHGTAYTRPVASGDRDNSSAFDSAVPDSVSQGKGCDKVAHPKHVEPDDGSTDTSSSYPSRDGGFSVSPATQGGSSDGIKLKKSRGSHQEGTPTVG
ncbi:hypothetical protein DRE_02655 [Drechslerella stenobrocha 248]|uniref:Uncharacterized protein n=1 Tax=Drechslerella stenobrocha 248 TaxID=1043628 RepID=W7HV64_9PEZI|nr:hypothetical protein DRE_02655 [Drechslerella stenobrocha 248]